MLRRIPPQKNTRNEGLRPNSPPTTACDLSFFCRSICAPECLQSTSNAVRPRSRRTGWIVVQNVAATCVLFGNGCAFKSHVWRASLGAFLIATVEYGSRMCLNCWSFSSAAYDCIFLFLFKGTAAYYENEYQSCLVSLPFSQSLGFL